MSRETSRNLAVIVLSTASTVEEADQLASTLVDERLAACVSRVPGILSTLRWKDKVEDSEEVLLLIKTHAGRAADLTRRLAELHSYEVPEILVVPVAAGLGAYLDWIRRETEVAGEQG